MLKRKLSVDSSHEAGPELKKQVSVDGSDEAGSDVNPFTVGTPYPVGAEALSEKLPKLEAAEDSKAKWSIDDSKLLIKTLGGAADLREALERNPTTLKIIFFPGALNQECFTALMDILKTNTVITHLDLNQSEIGVERLGAIEEVLKVNKTLTHLGLFANQMGDEEAIFLAGFLRTNTTITSLDLSSNDIGEAGAAELAKLLQFNHSLSELDLARNAIAEDNKYLEIIQAQCKVNKQILVFSTNPSGALVADYTTETEEEDFDVTATGDSSSGSEHGE